MSWNRLRPTVAWVLFSGFLSLAILDLVLAADFPIQLKSFISHSRLSLPADRSVVHEFKDTKNGFELKLKGLNLTDLGAPLLPRDEIEPVWKEKLKAVFDTRVVDLTIRETDDGVILVGKWKFPQGKLKLSDEKMESFVFHEDEPPQLVMDFWHKKGPTWIEAQSLKRKANIEQKKAEIEKKSKERQERRIAQIKQKADEDNVLQFCSTPLKDESDVFLAFGPAHNEVEFKKWIPNTAPDFQYHYFKPSGANEEANYVRLALQLYEKGKFGLVHRTLELYQRDYPHSQYRAEMLFLDANAMIRLGHSEPAEDLLRQILLDFKTSPVALHSGMFLAAKSVEKKSALNTLEHFLWLIQNYPDHRLNWVFHLGAAEQYNQLKQTDQAERHYRWILENARDRATQATAAFRIGDLYLSRQQYEQALASYYRASERYPEESKGNANLALNRGESLYQLGQYGDARRVFKDFLQNHAGYPQGWRATFRLAEIEGREAKSESFVQMRPWLLETINRYPFSAGATLARARLLPCELGGISQTAVNQFFSESAEKFDGSGEIFMDRYPLFKNLSYVRALVGAGDDEKAVHVSLDMIRKYATTETRKWFGVLAAKLFRKRILALLDEKKPYDAFKFYKAEIESVPLETVSPDFLLSLSRAVSDLQLGQFATQITEKHDSLMKLQAGRTLANEVKKDPEDLLNKMSEGERSYTKAKALWISEGVKKADDIRVLLAVVPDESPFSYDKEIVLTLLEEKEGKLSSALGHAKKAELLFPVNWDKKSLERISLLSWIAGLESKAGNPDNAIAIYAGLVEFYTKDKDKAGKLLTHERAPSSLYGLPSPDTLESALFSQGELYTKQKRYFDAAQVYDQAVQGGFGGNRAIYEYAQSLIKTGKPEFKAKIEESLKKAVASKEDDFWRKLAQEALAKL